MVTFGQGSDQMLRRRGRKRLPGGEAARTEAQLGELIDVVWACERAWDREIRIEATIKNWTAGR